MTTEASTTSTTTADTTPEATVSDTTSTPETTVETTAAPETTTEVKQEAQDWSKIVPAKFLKDGNPDWENFAKSYTNLEKKLGSKPNTPPSSIDEYDYKPQAYEVDDEAFTSFREEALSKGLSKDQFKWAMERFEQAIQPMLINPDKTEEALKEAWGKDYKNNLGSARKAFDEFAPSDLSMEDPIFNHPSVLKLLARIGSELGEDSVPPKSGGGSGGLTKAEIEAIVASRDYWDNPEKQQQVANWFRKNPNG